MDAVSILIWLSLVARSFHDFTIVVAILHRPIAHFSIQQKRCFAWELTGELEISLKNIHQITGLFFSDKRDPKYFGRFVHL